MRLTSRLFVKRPLLWRVDGADLLEQAECVPVGPALRDLAALEAVGLVAGMRHKLAGGSCAHDLTPMGTANGVAAYHFVPFGHLILDGNLGIGESAMDPLYRCLHVLSSHFSSSAGRIVKDEVRVQKFIYYICITLNVPLDEAA